MADMVTQKNIAAMLTPRLASSFAALTAGGAGNGVQILGTGVQRSLLGMPRSVSIVFPFTAALAAGKTLSLANVQLQTSPDGTNWTTLSTFADPGVVATGPSGGGAQTGQIVLGSYVSGAMDWLRVAFTPTLSATGSDTANLLALMIFSGFDRLPAPS